MISSTKQLTKQLNESKVQQLQNLKTKRIKLSTKQTTTSWKNRQNNRCNFGKGKTERCQEKLTEGKKIILEQQKLFKGII